MALRKGRERDALKKVNSNAVRWLWTVPGREKLNILFLTLAQALHGASGVVYALLLREIVDRAAGYDARGFFASVAALGGLIAAQLALRALIRWLSELSRSTLENIFKRRLMDTILHRDFLRVSALHSGEWMNRLTNDTKVVSDAYVDILPGLAGMIGFIIASSKVKSYVLKICFGSLAQTFGFLLFYGIFGLPIRTFPFIVAVEALFAFCRVYASKNIIYNGDSGASKRTAHSFMALIICACVAVATLLYPGYAISATNGEHIAKLVKSLTEGFNLPVFVTVMAVAAALFMFSELKSDVKGSADAYLAVSLAGLAISIRVLLTHLSIGGAIICAASAVAYYLVGFSMLSFMPSSDKSNPIYWMLGKGRFAAVLYSAIVSAMAAFSILFMYRGSIVSYLILVCGVVLALTSKRIFRGLAAAEAIRWQIILLTVYAFTMSVSVINGTIGKTWMLLTAVFVLFSIVMWGLGLRDGVNLPKKYRAFKVAGCVIAGAISVIAVITFG